MFRDGVDEGRRSSRLELQCKDFAFFSDRHAQIGRLIYLRQSCVTAALCPRNSTAVCMLHKDELQAKANKRAHMVDCRCKLLGPIRAERFCVPRSGGPHHIAEPSANRQQGEGPRLQEPLMRGFVLELCSNRGNEAALVVRPPHCPQTSKLPNLHNP